MSGRPRPPRGLLAVLAVAGVAFAVGMALGAATIFSGSESAGGSAETAQELPWLAETLVALGAVPGPVPVSAGATAASPTLLPAANAVFELGSGTAGHSAILWNLTLRSAPASTEVEVTASGMNASSGVPVTVTAYLESPATATTGPFVISLYLDLGLSGASLSSASLLLQQCAARGACA